MEIKTVLSSVPPFALKLAIFFLFWFVRLHVKKKYCFAIEYWSIVLFPSTSFPFDYFVTSSGFTAVKQEIASKNPPRTDSDVICFIAKAPVTRSNLTTKDPPKY